MTLSSSGRRSQAKTPSPTSSVAGADRKHCATVNIQIISWQAHAPTSLNGWAGFQNDAIRERPCVSNHFGFPSMQAVPVKSQNRPQPARREINRGLYQQVLHGSQQQQQNGCRAHDGEKLKHNVRALQSTCRCLKQPFNVRFRCRCACSTVQDQRLGSPTASVTVALQQRERPRVGMISLNKAVRRGSVNPVQKLGIIGAISFAR